MLLSELYKLRYLLLLELSLLIVFAMLELILFSFVFYYPLIPINIFNFQITNNRSSHINFSILVDAIIPFKDMSRGPTLFIEEIFLGLFLALFTIKFLLNLNNDIKIPLIILIWIPFLSGHCLLGYL